MRSKLIAAGLIAGVATTLAGVPAAHASTGTTAQASAQAGKVSATTAAARAGEKRLSCITVRWKWGDKAHNWRAYWIHNKCGRTVKVNYIKPGPDMGYRSLKHGKSFWKEYGVAVKPYGVRIYKNGTRYYNPASTFKRW